MPKIAVFMGIQNVGNDVANRSAFERLAPRSNSIRMRAYGSGLANHRQFLRNLGISPIETFHRANGKNSEVQAYVDVVLSFAVLLAFIN